MAARWKFRRDRFGGDLPETVLTMALLAVIYFGSVLPAQCAENQKTGLVELTDAQLDRVTAGGTSVALNLSASAQGPNASTSTQGSLQSAPTTILLINVDPSKPAVGQIGLQATEAVDLTFASGQATATGGTSRACSASIDIVNASNITYTAQTNSTAVTPNSVTCSCSAFIISRVAQ